MFLRRIFAIGQPCFPLCRLKDTPPESVPEPRRYAVERYASKHNKDTYPVWRCILSTRYIRVRGTMQISNGISYDVHSLFTPDVEIAPRVPLHSPARRAGNAELSLFSWQKESVYVAEAPRDFTRGCVYIFLAYFGPDPASLKPVQGNSRGNIRRLGIIRSRRRKSLFSAHRAV